jgi:hypothetical protein
VEDELEADITNLGGTGIVSYVWKVADTAAGEGSAIEGEISDKYTVDEADLNKYIKVTVSRAGYTGTITSGPSAKVVAAGQTQGDIELIGTVTITGTPTVYQTLTADTSKLIGGTEFTYQWARADDSEGTATPITNATSKTYGLGNADKGKYIQVTVSAASVGYEGDISSDLVGPIADPPSFMLEVNTFEITPPNNWWDGFHRFMFSDKNWQYAKNDAGKNIWKDNIIAAMVDMDEYDDETEAESALATMNLQFDTDGALVFWSEDEVVKYRTLFDESEIDVDTDDGEDRDMYEDEDCVYLKGWSSNWDGTYSYSAYKFEDESDPKNGAGVGLEWLIDAIDGGKKLYFIIESRVPAVSKWNVYIGQNTNNSDLPSWTDGVDDKHDHNMDNYGMASWNYASGTVYFVLDPTKLPSWSDFKAGYTYDKKVYPSIGYPHTSMNWSTGTSTLEPGSLSWGINNWDADTPLVKLHITFDADIIDGTGLTDKQVDDYNERGYATQKLMLRPTAQANLLD